jgi:hypothetical protein
MNRLTAYTIKFNQDLVDYLKENNIYFEIEDPCTQLNAKVIFLESVDIALLNFKPKFIESKYCRLPIFFFDNGSQEIPVRGNDYMNYSTIYENRTGKYDTEDC